MSDTPPLRILLSAPAQRALAEPIAEVLGDRPHLLVGPGDAFDIAFITREVTGLSTKHAVQPETQRWYDALLASPDLRWLQLHSAGADRPVYVELKRRGVAVTTASGANAEVVVQTALAGILALARRFPQLMAAQRARAWAPLVGSGAPRDLAGQTALIVGWGPIGRGLAAALRALGLRIAVARGSAEPAGPDIATAPFEALADLLPAADWLVLACPLTERTRRLIDGAALARLPAGAHVVNVSRGDVVDEAALIDALQRKHLAGAYLDVFEQEPLPAGSPLWAMDDVIVTPHSAGHSDGNEKRVAAIFLDNLARWHRGRPLLHRVA